MENKSKRKGLKQAPRAALKFKLRYAVIGSSMLAMMAVAFIYMNFSQSEVSKAGDRDNEYVVTYRTTDAVVPKRMLLDSTMLSKTAPSNYKADPTIKHTDLSRATDILAPNIQ